MADHASLSSFSDEKPGDSQSAMILRSFSSMLRAASGIDVEQITRAHAQAADLDGLADVDQVDVGVRER